MTKLKNDIIPKSPHLISTGNDDKLDLKAICIFAAIGFFLDQDTFWLNKKVLPAASINELSSNNTLEKSKTYFEWHYTPRELAFSDAVDEFSVLFETIISEQTSGKKVILPLSGGLDSRTQAAALKYLNADVSAYSYEYENGFAESKIAQQVADVCGFDFHSYKIKKGYLWERLDELVKLNQCYSDFTSPRQMAISEKFSSLGDVFSLGHWGDVLFDSYGLNEIPHDEQVQFLSQKLLKRNGLQFAEDLWASWGIKGDFKSYFLKRISDALGTIDIDNTNARLRAFKSKFWAPRWTSVNLSIFENSKSITLPYYDNRMCEFICTIPEDYLNDRKIQIEYIKRRNPELAKLMWQDKRPYNLYNYRAPNSLKTIRYKISNKLNRGILRLTGQKYIQRNWELQFLGEANNAELRDVLLESKLSKFISKPVIDKYLNGFYSGEELKNAHPLNMLLVLAKFNQTQNHG
ncbi:MAG: asparagine synthase [Winogradskyella sp.]|uniref:asparagine synthase C-terminal domain-containing protein n=1 Tax=Winogradskyella sp. TaxID=1883156 RepID=UPI000F40AC1E|nr:asparagine synthase C-terminal domain-containing protein [Winogradskyella sp.]RNC86890.1 MAG: asparagine synthase [Winogradskyella sp.]